MFVMISIMVFRNKSLLKLYKLLILDTVDTDITHLENVETVHIFDEMVKISVCIYMRVLSVMCRWIVFM